MKRITKLVLSAALVMCPAMAHAQLDTMWTNTYSKAGNSNDYGNDCAVDSAGEFVYSVGYSNINTIYGYLAVKYNASTGDTVWARTTSAGTNQYGFNACALDKQGGLYAIGGDSIFFVAKYNVNTGGFFWINLQIVGKALWCETDSDGNAYVVGFCQGAGPQQRYWLVVKYNAAGDTLWSRRYWTPADTINYATSCAVDKNGNLFVFGRVGPDHNGLHVIKYSTMTGDTVWTRHYTTPVSAYTYGCAVDDSGGLYVHGCYDDGNADYLTVKYDAATGDTVWSRKINGPDNGVDFGGGCVVDRQGKMLYATGYINLGGNQDIWTVVYDAKSGVPLGSHRYNGVANSNDVAWGCDLDKNGQLYIAGMTRNASYEDLITIKYRLFLPPPQLISPPNNAYRANGTLDLVWHPADSAFSYRVQLAMDTAFTIALADTHTADTLWPRSGLGDGQWFWRIKSYTAGMADSSAWSPIRTFHVDTGTPLPPVLKGPPDMALVSGGPNLGWAASVDAQLYGVQVSYDSSFVVVSNDTVTTDTFRWVPPLADGKYFWRVRAGDSAGHWSGYGEVRRYRKDATPPVISWTHPDSGAVNFLYSDTIKIAFSEPILSGSFMYSFTPTVALVYGGGSSDTMKLWSPWFNLGATYTLTVTAANDSAGNALAAGPVPNPFTFTMTTDSIPPVIAHTPSGAALNPGVAAVIDATITDSQNGIDQARLCYRVGGAAAFTELAMSPQPGDVYRASIPGAAVTERGLSYYVRATDVLGNQTLSPAGAPAVRHHRSVAIATSAPAQPLPAGYYRMLSLPCRSSGAAYRPDAFDDDFGAYDNTKWRIFRWQGGGYQEYGAIEDLIPGRAFWLVTRAGGTPDVDAALTVPDSAWHIPLGQGWNMVGPPFGYVVNRTELRVYEGGGSEYAFADTANILTEHRLVEFDGGGYSNKTQLEPWKGYWVKSLVPSATLVVPARAAAKSEGGGKEEGWSLDFAAECGAFHDRDNRAAVTPRGARDDASEPPAMGPHVTLAFDRGGARLAEDCRADIGAGQSWRFMVETDQAGQVELSWREQGVNGGWQYQVFDVTAGRALEQGGSYAFQPEPGRPREFAVLVGSAAYIAEESGNAGLVPAVTALSQNRPNPFAGATTISYQLAGAGRVSLKLYNVAGQLVRVLEDGQRTAGRYALRWDGRDGTGRPLPNGLYFYRLEAPGLTATRKLTLVR